MEPAKQPTEATESLDVNKVIKELKDQSDSLEARYQAFKDGFAQIGILLAAKLSVAFNGPFKSADQYQHQVKVASPEEAGTILKTKKLIVILTGAGVSAASGIPTFRGQDGFWKQRKTYGGCENPEQILTYDFFKQKPAAVWEWHYDFYELQAKCQPNTSHKIIVDFQEFCAQSKDVQTMLVTQNIDDFHSQKIRESEILMRTSDRTLDKYEGNIPVAFTPHVYEIHGNSFYMHCSDEEQEHSKKFYPCPKLGSVVDRTNHVPLCPDCEKPMKPHSMFFDESYSEHYYRKQTVDNIVETADCLIVIGTALATSYAARIVGNFLVEEKPVIEINLEPCVQVGHTYHVVGKSEEVLPKMFASYHQKLAIPAQQSVNVNTQKTTMKPPTQPKVIGKSSSNQSKISNKKNPLYSSSTKQAKK